MENLKRTSALVLAAVMLLTLHLTAYAASGTGYTDVPENTWYTEAVEYVSSHGLMTGTSDTTFSPDQPTSRAMLATILYRNAGRPSVSTAAGFTDVADGTWYSDAVGWAVENEIISGYGNGLFGPDDPVTREQFAEILWRYEGRPAAVGEDFADEGSISSFASAAVDWVSANRIMNGVGENRFDPQGDATRAQTAQILMNYLAPKEDDSEDDSGAEPAGKILVAYYSATGSTQTVAETIADYLSADTFVITPVEPYTSADLNWTDNSSRVVQEHNDPANRHVALTTTEVPDFDSYDTVFIGYPIWWGNAAWPVDGFIAANDFTGKTVIPFCTSSSSPLGSSGTDLAALAGTGTWLEGQRFSSSVSASTVEQWLDGLDLQ